MWLKILVLLQKNSQILNQPFIEEYRYFNFKHIVRQVYENKVNINCISILYKIFCLEQLAVKAWCLRICYKICWRVGNQSKLISWRVRSYPGNCPRNLVLYLDSYVLEVMEFWYQLGQWASFYIYEWLWFQHIFFYFVYENDANARIFGLKTYRNHSKWVSWVYTGLNALKPGQLMMT